MKFEFKTNILRSLKKIAYLQIVTFVLKVGLTAFV